MLRLLRALPLLLLLLFLHQNGSQAAAVAIHRHSSPIREEGAATLAVAAAAAVDGDGGDGIGARTATSGAAWPWPPVVDPVANVLRLADCLYNQRNLSCIDAYCAPRVVVRGDGVLLPRAPFVGVEWARHVHAELLAAYPDWRHEALEVAATTIAGGGSSGGSRGSGSGSGARGFADVFVLFRWRATNAGPFRGAAPTGRASVDYGVLRAAVDKSGAVAEVALRRSGFAEEREALVRKGGACLQAFGNAMQTTHTRKQVEITASPPKHARQQPNNARRSSSRPPRTTPSRRAAASTRRRSGRRARACA